MTSSFDIVDVAELNTAQIVEVINTAFGRVESPDWFRWKHRDGPWGPSIGVAAVDQEGPIGVRLLLPWRFRLGNNTWLGHRATEAATIPRAQGKGVFTALNRWMMEEVSTELIFSTPNMNSRGGYLKLGWNEIATVPHRWELARPSRRAMGTQSMAANGLHTDWNSASLQWRADPRSGAAYEEVNSDNAVVYYRVLRRRGVRMIAPLGTFGDDAELAILWRRALRETKAHVVLRPATQSMPIRSRMPALRRGESLILGWRPSDSVFATTHPRALESVPWSAADLEGVI